MKTRLFLLLLALNLSIGLSAQTFRFQYSHDTLGNRTSRVYQGLVPTKAGASLQDTGHAEDESAVKTLDYYSPDTAIVDPLFQAAEKDTTHYGSLMKTPEEKEAYERQMMEEAMKVLPIPSGGGRSLNDYSVGAIPLEYGVSGTGARTYSVPVFTAPDIKYAPNISLVYNSQGGYGYGGYGWDLAGLSAITLTNKTNYWDGTIKAASAQDTAGVFCLDGIRLVANDDATTCNAYPLVTATGRVLVAPHRNSRNYIISFTALFPDGTRAIYGTSTDKGYTMPIFPVTRTTNIKGEKIEYTYAYNPADTLDIRPTITSINYGFDGNGNPSAHISFVQKWGYSIYGYCAGKKVSRPPILSHIESYAGNVELYDYALSYQNVNNSDLLTAIALSNSTGEQLPPLSFTYGAANPPHTGPDSLKVIHTIPASTDIPFSCPDGFVLRRGKFVKGSHNDGLIGYSDYDTYVKTNPYKYECSYPDQSTIVFIESISDDNSSSSSIVADAGFQTAEAVDVDGDGIDEVVRVRASAASPYASGTQLFVDVFRNYSGVLSQYGNTITISLNGIIENNNYFSPYRRAYRWGDFLGNGKTQLLVLSYADNGFGEYQDTYISLIDLSAGTELFEMSYPGIRVAYNEDKCILCLDIDGDARTELCVATVDSLEVYHCTSGGIISDRSRSTINKTIVNSSCVYYADINADGYVDIIQSPSPGNVWTYRINTGEEFVVRTMTHCQSSAEHQFMFMDIDRDGYADLVEVFNNHVGFYRNYNGVYFNSYQNASLYVGSIGQILPSNTVDNTAMSCFVTIDAQDIREYGYTTLAPDLWQLIQSRDSFGKIVRNTYGYLPQSSLYWTDNPAGISAADGYQLRVLPVYVLTSANGFMSEDSGAQRFMRETYSWYDGVVNTQGLGFCGFSKTRVHSYLEDVHLYSENKYDPQRRGILTQSKQYIDFESPFSLSTFTYYSFTEHGKPSPRLYQSVSTDANTGVTATTTYSYDDFYFPTKVITRKSRSGFATWASATETSYIHNNSTDKYVLGAVASQTSVATNNINVSSARGTKAVYSLDTLFRPVSRLNYTVASTISAYNYNPTYNTCYLASQERWRYDSHGNVTREESAPSGSDVFIGTSSTYDASGRHLVSSTDALGHTTTYSGFDVYGNPSVVTNYKGQQTHAYRNGWGRVTRTVHPDGTVDSLARAWGGSGAYTETSLSSGAPDVVVDYDAAGREVLSSQKRFDGQWQKVATQYDTKGRTYRVSLPYRGSSPSYWNTYRYDDFDRPIQYLEASGRKTTWSYSGTSTTERKDGIRVTRTLNPAGELYSVADSLCTITYTYRDDGQPSSVSATGGAVTTFTYDTLGRRTSIVDPSAGTRSTSYLVNADGSSVVTQTNALGSIVTSTDSLGRTTSIVRPDFNTVFAYDTCGRLVSSVSTNGTCERYTYDSYDRLLTAKDSVPDGKWLQKAYTYNSDGTVASVSYTSQSGYITSELFFYANGHNHKITTDGGTLVYQVTTENNFGLPNMAYSGNVRRTYSYNSYGLPVTRRLNMGILQDFSYSFDATTGNLISRSMTVSGTTTTESFSYDNLGRLSAFDNHSVSYDVNNNITSLYGSDILSYANASHPYTITSRDLPAQPTSGTASQTVTYKAYDRPATISQGYKTATFTYNSSHDRVKMHVARLDGDLTRYYVGARYEIEIDADSGITKENLYLGGDAYSAPMVMQKVGNGGWTYYVIGRDYLGSITNIAATNGANVERRNYGAWGSGTPSSTLRRGWCGHEHLTDFGLINMNARLYDPVLGRFLSPDPYVQAPDLPGNFNRYSYCLNNPMKYNDRTGELFGIDDAILFVATSFMVGGAVGGYQGYKIGAAKGLTGNDMLAYIACGAIIGVASSLVGGYVAAAVAPAVAAAGCSGFVGGALTGAFSGASAGAVNGFGFGMISTSDPDMAMNAAAQCILLGMCSGAAMGGVLQGIAAKLDGRDFWTGHSKPTIELLQQTIRNEKPIVIEESTLKRASIIPDTNHYDFSMDPDGSYVTLYRGTTGSEGDAGPLFMTNNPDYAATYVKNGGQIVQAKIPRLTLYRMQYNGDLIIQTGLHLTGNDLSFYTSAYLEYMFTPHVKPFIVNLFTPY